MTSPKPARSTPRKRTWRDYWTKATGALIILAAIATIGSFYLALITLQSSSNDPNQESTEAPGGSASSGESTRSSESATSFAQLKPGTCLNEAGSAVSCDLQPFSELIAASGPCDLSALVDYAGGTFTTDVLRGDLHTTMTSVGCIVKIPEGLTTKVQGGLTSREHAALRKCWDRFSDRDVSCDEAHTAEVVYFNPSPEAATVSCSSRADSYMDDAFSRHQAKLEAVKKSLGQSVSCLVQAKGSNEIRGSLRDLGTGALPLQPRP